MQLPLMTTRGWMIAVVGASILFAWLGVTAMVATLALAFVVSALITRPGNWHEWLVFLIAAFAALPSVLLAIPYTFALRAALFLGHWPYYGHPDPKALPKQFSPPEYLESLIPATIFVVLSSFVTFLNFRSGPPERRLFSAGVTAVALWLLAFLLAASDPAGVIEWIMD